MKFKKYLASVSYDGSCYSGFTKSLNKLTIQDEIEKALISIFSIYNFEPEIKCASRTDAGVHAIGQLIVFSLPADKISCDKLIHIINSYLPLTIRFNSLIETDKSFSLYSSIESKEYVYLVSKNQLSPFLSRYIWFFDYGDEFERLEKIVSLFKGEHNFSFLCKDAKKYKSTICRLFESNVFSLNDKSILAFYFKGNRFLYNMVRRLVGCTLTLATYINEPLLEDFSSLASPEYLRFTTFKAPPNGLYLLRVNLVNFGI